MYDEILNILDKYIYLKKEIEEIRIRVNKKIILKSRNKDVRVSYVVENNEIMYILEKICDNSIYAYKNQIIQGYITIKGGHRVGIVGTCIVENEKIVNIKNITSLNFRVARQIKGAGNKIAIEIINKEQNRIYNTLIVSPPGKGKTTILKDLIYIFSNGIQDAITPKTIGVVDERGEIGGSYRGSFANDLGDKTDVIENVSKYQGINMLIRSMAPEIIACDEIGSKEDVAAIKYAFSSGIYGIFTMHGKSLEDVNRNVEIKELIDSKLIEKIVFL